MKHSPSSVARHLLALGIAAVAVACGGSERRKPAAVEATSSRVDVFLRCTDPGSRDVTLTIQSASLRGASGELHPIALEGRELRSGELGT